MVGRATFQRDPNQASERNRLKLENKTVPLARGDEFLLAELSVPGELCSRLGYLSSRAAQLLDLIRQQSGINCPQHRPFVSVQASFLLTHSQTGQTRVFTGTVQTAYRNKNQIIPERIIASVSDFQQLIERAINPDFLESSLSSAEHFPDSNWEFAGVISIVFVFNCRARVRPLPKYTKSFPILD